MRDADRRVSGRDVRDEAPDEVLPVWGRVCPGAAQDADRRVSDRGVRGEAPDEVLPVWGRVCPDAAQGADRRGGDRDVRDRDVRDRGVRDEVQVCEEDYRDAVPEAPPLPHEATGKPSCRR